MVLVEGSMSDINKENGVVLVADSGQMIPCQVSWRSSIDKLPENQNVCVYSQNGAFL